MVSKDERQVIEELLRKVGPIEREELRARLSRLLEEEE